MCGATTYLKNPRSVFFCRFGLSQCLWYLHLIPDTQIRALWSVCRRTPLPSMFYVLLWLHLFFCRLLQAESRSVQIRVLTPWGFRTWLYLWVSEISEWFIIWLKQTFKCDWITQRYCSEYIVVHSCKDGGEIQVRSIFSSSPTFPALADGEEDFEYEWNAGTFLGSLNKAFFSWTPNILLLK